MSISDSKTFGGLPVAQGSTTIKLVGNVHTHIQNQHNSWQNRSYTMACAYKVALYSGSTLLHTTGWTGYYWYGNGTFTKTWSTNTSKNITKAILYTKIGANNRYYNYCHAYSAVTLTIG